MWSLAQLQHGTWCVLERTEDCKVAFEQIFSFLLSVVVCFLCLCACTSGIRSASGCAAGRWFSFGENSLEWHGGQLKTKLQLVRFTQDATAVFLAVSCVARHTRSRDVPAWQAGAKLVTRTSCAGLALARTGGQVSSSCTQKKAAVPSPQFLVRNGTSGCWCSRVDKERGL